MKKYFNVLLAEGDGEMRSALKELLVKSGNINVSAAVDTGAKALELVRDLRPDILVTSLYLCDMDGMGLLEKTAELPEDVRPAMLMISPVSDPLILRACASLGASVFVMTPLSFQELIPRIRLLAGAEEPRQEDGYLNLIIDDLLYDLGVPVHLSGYMYMHEGIAIAYFQPAALNAVTKLLYPEIARRTGSTSERVERSIRCAVEAVWKRGGVESMRKIVGPYLQHKPTNGEMIASAVRELRRRISQKDVV